MKIINSLLLFIVTLFTACNPSKTIEDFADDRKEEIAQYYIDQLIEGNYEEIRASFELRYRESATDDLFNHMRSMLGDSEPQSIDLIGYYSNKINNKPIEYNLSYQYGYGDRWVLLNVAFRILESGDTELFAMNVYNPMSKPLQEQHKFTFENKATIHYVFLICGVTIPTFILVTLIVAVRTKFKKRKGLWILFILVAMVQFSLNWTTGQVGIHFFYFQLFGSGAMCSSIYSPWIFSFSLPLGAILFWLKRDKLTQENLQQGVEVDPVE